MVRTEIITLNGVQYVRTWSDRNVMIERNGGLYEEAIDPMGTNRTYVETEQSIPDRELSDSDALAFLTGGVYGNEIE